MIGWIKKLFTKPTPPIKAYIWGVVQGPVRAEDIPGCDFDDDCVMMILKVSVGERVFDAEFWFDGLDSAYPIVSHFHKDMRPIPLDSQEYERVK